MTRRKLTTTVQVGTAIFLRRQIDGKDHYLVGLRHGSHAEGEWWIPGGKPEPGESPEEAAIRELSEETGLRCTNVRSLGWDYDAHPDWDRHFVCVYYLADWVDGEAELKEPEKCLEWKWVEGDDLEEHYANHKLLLATL